MKYAKIIITILIFVFVFAFSSIAEEMNFEPFNGTVYIDGEEIEIIAKPMLSDVRRWLPLGEICDYLGYNITADTNTKEVSITPSENCRNSDAHIDNVVFEIGSEKIMMYSDDYENKIENIYTSDDDVYSPMTYMIDDEIYMNSYYMQRAFHLKIKHFSELDKDTIKIYTQNYIISAAANAKPLIAVHANLDISIEGIRANFKSAPIIDENSRTLVPVREFCELLNKSLNWFDEPPRVCISEALAIPESSDLGHSGGSSLWFTIDENRYRINGTYYDMDTYARLINGKTYVPLRILAEYLGYSVVYAPVSGS